MQSLSDAQLIRDYTEHGSERAFEEIVNRHANLVYSCALRQAGSPEVAADIAQNVFLGLARGARPLLARLPAEASLAGWLCRATRNLSLNTRRDEYRRHSREQQAMETSHATPEAELDWERLRPVLDDAMSELSEPDYDALVARFYQNRDLRAVGRLLGVSDDAAQKRVVRALDKLRELLSRRGITTSAAALSLALAANAVQSAPAGLAAAIAATALAGGALTTATVLTTAKTITMTTLQKALVGLALAAAASAGIYESTQAAHWRDKFNELEQEQSGKLRQAERERDGARGKLAELQSENERLNKNTGELLKLRGEVTRLRQEKEIAARRPVENPVPSAPAASDPAPNTNSYTASVDVLVPWGQTLVTGGWRMPSGNRTFVMVTPSRINDGENQLHLATRIIEVSAAAVSALRLDQAGAGDREVTTSFFISPEQFDALKNSQDGVYLASSPSVTTESGREAQISMMKDSADSPPMGMTVNYVPVISANGNSVQMKINANLQGSLPRPDQ